MQEQSAHVLNGETQADTWWADALLNALSTVLWDCSRWARRSSSPVSPKRRKPGGLSVQMQLERLCNLSSQCGHISLLSLWMPHLKGQPYISPVTASGVYFTVRRPQWMCLYVSWTCITFLCASCPSTYATVCVCLSPSLPSSLTLPPSITFCLCEWACRVIQGVNYRGCLSGWNKNPAQAA